MLAAFGAGPISGIKAERYAPPSYCPARTRLLGRRAMIPVAVKVLKRKDARDDY